jgi:hypothetical protein
LRAYGRALPYRQKFGTFLNARALEDALSKSNASFEQ